MPAQGKNSAARAADVAQQQLQNRRRANDLHALGVLRPSHGVADGCGFVRTRGIAKCLGDFQEQLLRNPRMPLDQFRRVARKMPSQNLEDAAGVLQRGIGFVLVHLRSFAAAIFAVPTAGRRMS